MDGELLAGLMLVICVPVYASIYIDQFHDILPDEDYGHDELESAIETFNSTMSSVILSWIPGGFRLKGV